MKMQRWGKARPNHPAVLLLYSTCGLTLERVQYQGPHFNPDTEEEELDKEEEVIINENGQSLVPRPRDLWCELPDSLAWASSPTEKREDPDGDSNWIAEGDSTIAGRVLDALTTTPDDEGESSDGDNTLDDEEEEQEQESSKEEGEAILKRERELAIKRERESLAGQLAQNKTKLDVLFREKNKSDCDVRIMKAEIAVLQAAKDVITEKKRMLTILNQELVEKGK